MRQIKVLGDVSGTSFSVGEENVVDKAGKIDYSSLKNVPTTFEPVDHDHNDAYYEKAAIDSHLNNKNNPHVVTKAQVGLANVDNVKQATKAEFDVHATDLNKHITPIERTEWNEKAEKLHDHPISQVTNLQTELDKKETTINFNAKTTELKTSIDTHVADVIKHITGTERINWNAKETSASAQTKVDLLEAKLAALGFASVSKITTQDANTMKTNGLYYMVNSTNIPNSSDGYLSVEVYTLGYVKQTFTNANDLSTHMRILVNNVWKSWGHVEMDTDTQAKFAQAVANAKTYTDSVTLTKVDKVAGKGLSTQDYTTEEKTKLTGIEADANNYVHPATHPASIITQDSTRRMVSDSKIEEWDAKETPSGSAAKANAAEDNAKAHSDLNDAMFNHNASLKIFNKPAVFHQNTNAMPGSLVIKAPIGFKNNMISLRLFGYNYTERTTNMDLTLSFYSYSTESYLQSGYVNRGDFKITSVRGAKDASGRLVLIIDTPGSLWSYPKLWIEHLMMSYATILDSDGIGWTMGLEMDLTPYTILKIFPGTETESTIGAQERVDAHAVDVVKHLTPAERTTWNAKETTIGAKAKADAAVVESKTYTDAEVAKIKPGGIGAETPEGSQAKVDAHVADKQNPHAVTKAQVGLSLVDNVKQATKAEFDAHVADAIKHITTAERTAWNAKETPAAAQTKVNLGVAISKQYTDEEVAKIGPGAIGAETPAGAQAKVDTHANDLVKHITGVERTTWNAKETPAGSQSKVDVHANKKDNPHAVTKTQIGLSAVDDVKQATKTEFDTHAADSVKHITTAERTDWNAKETPAGSQAKATKALDDSKVYADQKIADVVGSAPETLDALGELATALGNDPNFATTVATSIGMKADKEFVDAHIANKINPHAVTKAQIGLPLVDNVKQATKAEFDTHVADGVKHVTVAERAAWNAKAEGTHNHPISQVTNLQTELDSKETPAGAQTKATTSENSAKAYSDSLIGNRIIDNRAVVPKPSDYAANRTAQEFKSSTSVGLNGKAGNYVHVFSERAWSDPSGGYVRQLAYDGLTTKIWTRFGNQTTNVWGDWDELESTVGAQEKVNAHAADTIKHVSPAERTTWNGKAAASHLHTIAQITGLQAELDAKETPAGVQAKVNTHAGDAVAHITAAERTAWNAKESTGGSQARVDAHIADKANPHGVTKTQIGLSNVENAKQATKTEFDSHNNDGNRHITVSERAAWDAKASGTHTHGIGDLTGLQAQLDGKAPVVHTHTVAQVTSLQTLLDAKETPAAAQSKATTAKSEAIAASVSKAGDTMTGELKMQDKITFKSKFSVDFNPTENSLDFSFTV